MQDNNHPQAFTAPMTHLSRLVALSALLLFGIAPGNIPSASAQNGFVEIGPHAGSGNTLGLPGPPFSTARGNYLRILQVQYSYNGGPNFVPGTAAAPTLTGNFNSATGANALKNASLFNSTSGKYIGSNGNRPRLANGDTFVVKEIVIDLDGPDVPGGNFHLKVKPLNATVTNFNYPMNVAWSELSGIYASVGGNRTNIAIQNGTSGPHTPNNPAWINAAQQIFASADMNSLLAHDSGGSLGPYDYDVRFSTPLTQNDFVLVAERNGNTYFELIPLDINGNVITGANILRFGFPTGTAHTRYDYRTGIIPAGDAGIGNGASGQDQAMSIAPTTLFFNNNFGKPNASASTQDIYGFRVNNDGQADILVFGLEPVPEPGTILFSLVLIGLVGGTLARRHIAARKSAVSS